jgi:ribonuclease HI
MSRSNNTRGRALTDFIIENSLNVENTGCTPTYESRLGKSIIDLTLTRGLPVMVKNWEVDRRFNHTDHNTIKFYLEADIIELEPQRLWEKTDWLKYQEELNSREVAITSEINSDKIENIVNNLYGCIEVALDKACPKNKGSTINLSNPWYTKGLESKRKELHALYAKFRDSKFTKGETVYKRKLRSYKKHCDKARSKYRQKYKESLQDVKEVTDYVKRLDSNKPPSIGTVKRADGIYTLPGEETLKELANIHFEGHAKGKKVDKKLSKIPTSQIREENNDWINKDRVKAAFEEFKLKKSPGTDGLKPVALKYLTDNMVDCIVFLYKAVIATGYTPREWTKARVVFIPKPGKSDYTNPKSYRPISLTNYLLKGLEKLCRWKMKEMLENHPLHEFQHGFTKGLSTDTAISRTTNFIEQRIMNGQYCLGVFLDIQAAFDSIDPVHIKQSLLRHGCPQDLADWYYNYLTHREILIQGRDAEYTTVIQKGFPQGGVCSASFWAIAYDPAVRILNARGIVGQVYADDSCALVGGTDLGWMFQRMNQVLMQLEAWGKTCGLRFNPQKTEAVLFSRDNPSKRKFKIPDLKLGGKKIELKETVKYLGVTLDRKLHWDRHVNLKLEEARKFMMKLFADLRGNFGPKPGLIKWAYEGIIRPKISYAALVWGHETGSKSIKLKLRSLDRLAVRAMVTLARSTPQAGAEVILGLLPLDLHIEQCGIQARSRLSTKLAPPWQNISKLTKLHSNPHLWHWEQKIEEMGVLLTSNDSCFEYIWNRGFSVNTDSFTGEAKHRSHAEVTIYTDGSKTEQGVGAGFVLYKRRKVEYYESFKLDDHATVFQAEVMAILKGIEYVLLGGNIKFLKVLSDSQAALLALHNKIVTSKLVLETMRRLEELVDRGCVVRLAWVKAHIGLEGNELADEAAKLGASNEMGILRRPTVEKPFSRIKTEIKEAINLEWARRWQTDPMCRMTKEFFSVPNKSKSKMILRHGKSTVSRLIQIITGHNFLSYYQSKIDKGINPMCRQCGEENETFYHLLVHCDAFEGVRRSIFMDAAVDGSNWKPGDLLQFSYKEPINSWLTDRDYLMEQPQYELEMNCSLTDSDGSL